MTATPYFEYLEAPECWRFVEAHDFGRLAFLGDRRVQLLPQHYRAAPPTIYMRASPFGPVARHAREQHGTASLGVDEIDDQGTSGWSVVLSGATHVVDSASVLSSLWTPSRSHPWTPYAETLWVAVEVDGVQGRRVRAA